MNNGIAWLLGIVLPIALIASASFLVAVRIETRQENAERAQRKFQNWLREGVRLRRRHRVAWRTFGRCEADRNIRSYRGMRNSLLAGICAASILWTKLLASFGRYLDADRYTRMEERRDFMSKRASEHELTAKLDREVAKKMLRTSVSWEAFFDQRGWIVVSGAAIVVLASLVGWRLESAIGDWIWSVGPGLIAVALCVEFLGKRDATRLFVWGCVIALYLGLTTFEIGPLGEELEGQVDAQRVNAMFVAVAVMLTLCQFFVFLERADVGRIRRDEIDMVEKSDRLTVWGSMSRGLFGMMRKLHESWWILIVLSLYAISIVEFVGSITEEVCLNGGCSLDGTRLVFAVTAGGLFLPFIVFAGATRARALSFLVGTLTALGVTAVLLFRALMENPPLSEPVTRYTPVVAVDTVVANLALSSGERKVLEEVILFEFEDGELTEDAKGRLALKVLVLEERPGVELRIEGHADELGDERFNYDLGNQRAEAVFRFLVDAQLDSTRFSKFSHGEARPRSEGNSIEARAQNRRVEFVVTKHATLEALIMEEDTVVIIMADTANARGT